MIVLKLLAAVWGACLASFINTVIWRLLNQISLFDPQRSYCDSCHQQLIWWQLIPVAADSGHRLADSKRSVSFLSCIYRLLLNI